MKHLFLVVAALTLGACSSVTEWSAIGGSRADGTVKMIYEAGEFDSSQPDNRIAYQKALKRCKLWGYTNAEAFDTVKTCVNTVGVLSNCGRWRYSRQYQCTNHKSDISTPAGGATLKPVN